MTSSYLRLEEIHPGMLLMEYGDDSRHWYVMVLAQPDATGTYIPVFDFRLGRKGHRNAQYLMRSRVQK